ncbi:MULTISPECIES: SIR2 family protein [Myroides]|uniref:SIR2 family protein n=1 Tax=Myroides TaxID=76831 RepID=UPI0015F9A6B7|nr:MULTISPECIES: SIR2 family protein [Myroides]MBB1139295.1 SIR2 family protein [Myroides sp. WP-1]MDM1499638.1 SIR2 family protein [Myroides odoratimimus]
MIKWPDKLIDIIAKRRCVIVIGAGVSKNSTNNQGVRPCDWKEFLEKANNGLPHSLEIKKQIKNYDFLTACELIKRDMGDEEFNDLVKSEFLTPSFNNAEIHKYIFNLDSKIVITPNFDKIYDTYANTASNGTISVKNFYDENIIASIRDNERVIIKIHGSVDSPDNLIFTRKDYSKARTKYKNFYSMLEALFLTHTFIFIGCGVNDPDIRLILEDYTFKYPFGTKHYIIMPQKSIHKQVQIVLAETMSLKVIEYDSKNNHAILTESLEKLVQCVELKRSEIAEAQSW